MLGIAVLVALVIATVLVAPNPFKVTDPADPRFDPEKFSFRDYGGIGEIPLKDAMQILFPPGTEKSFVDHVLVDTARVPNYGCLSNAKLCAYYYPVYMQDAKGGKKILFVFDDEWKTASRIYDQEFIELIDKDKSNE